jgi:hypothetical protein
MKPANTPFEGLEAVLVADLRRSEIVSLPVLLARIAFAGIVIGLGILSWNANDRVHAGALTSKHCSLIVAPAGS